MKAHLDRLPILVLEPHNRCNCRCVMCDIWKLTDAQEISAAELQRHMADIAALGVEWVVFTGGEPLMHPALFRLSAMLRERGIRTTLLSTGLLLERYAEAIAGGMDDVIVSLDGPAAVHDAIRQLRDVEAFRPTFIEQPVPGHHRAALAEITRALDTPVLADESVFTPSDALLVAAGRMADLVSIKIMKHGGMLAGRKVAAICEAAGIACYGGDMFETGIAHLAGTHVIAATPNISLGCEFYQAKYFLERDLLAEPFPIENGRVIVPRTPGLGIEVDEDLVKHYAVETLA